MAIVATKIAIVCWGYSIHARRRIEVFAQDNRFNVLVISNYSYEIENVTTVCLTNPSEYPAPKYQEKIRQFFRRHNLKIPALLYYSLQFLVGLFFDIKLAVKDSIRMREAIKCFKPDIVLLQTLIYPCYLAYFLPRKIPLAITFWNGDVIWWAKWNGIERLFKKWIVRYGIGRARLITANSQSAFNGAIAQGAKERQLRLIRYPGVDIVRFAPGDKMTARQKIKIKTDKKIILCPRGLGGYINSDIIMQVANIVLRKRDDVLFCFLSHSYMDGWEQHLSMIDSEFCKKHNFVYEYGIEWEDMPLYYQSSDVVVSILSNDSQPNCMLESMACKTPLIMGDIPSIREWIQDGENGILVRPREAEALASAIIRLLDNNPLASKFCDINFKLVKDRADMKTQTDLIKNEILKAIGQYR